MHATGVPPLGPFLYSSASPLLHLSAPAPALPLPLSGHRPKTILFYSLVYTVQATKACSTPWTHIRHPFFPQRVFVVLVVVAIYVWIFYNRDYVFLALAARPLQVFFKFWFYSFLVSAFPYDDHRNAWAAPLIPESLLGRRADR